MKAMPLMYIQGPEVSCRPGPPRAKNAPARTTRTSRTRPGWRWIIGHLSGIGGGLHRRAAVVPRSWGARTRRAGTPLPRGTGGVRAEARRARDLGRLVPVGGGQLHEDVRHVVAH